MGVKLGQIKGAQKRWLSSLVVGTIIGAAILAAIIAWAGLGNVWESFGNINYADLAVYVGLAICTYFFRAWRFQLLVNRGSLSKFYGIVSVHTLMVNLLPFSSGEISYPVLLRRYGVSPDFLQGIPSLVIARAQDIFINLSLVVIALVWVGNGRLILGGISSEFTVLLGLAVVAIVIAGWLTYQIWGRTSAKARRIIGFMFAAVAPVKETTLRTWAATFLLTISIRMISIVGVFYLLGSVGVTLPLAAVFLITSLYVFLPLLPLNTPAGLGITEAFLLGFFLVSGIDRAAATAASLQIHSIQLGVAAILGAIGLIQLQYLKWRSSISSKNPVLLLHDKG